MATRSNGRAGSPRKAGDAETAALRQVSSDTSSGAALPIKYDLEIDPELAALLDGETINAESPNAAEAGCDSNGSVQTAAEPENHPCVGDGSRPDNGAGHGALTMTPTGGYLSTVLDRPLPATKRFGAIILETSARGTRSGDLVAAGVDPRAVPPGPGHENADPGALPPVVIRTEDQKSYVIKRLDSVRDQEWQRKFHDRIDQLYKEISTEFTTPPDVAQKLLEMLREARQMMIDTPEEFGSAEYRVMQVATAVERRRQSRRQARFLGPCLFLYLAFWLAAFTAALVFSNQITAYVQQWAKFDAVQVTNLAPVFITMLWGGIGGAVGGLYALWYHIADRQDFNKTYSMWYYVQPLMGVVLGAIMFLILAGGFLIVQVNIADANANTGAKLIPYLVALLAGFKQDFVYDQLERLVAVFVPNPAKVRAGESK